MNNLGAGVQWQLSRQLYGLLLLLIIPCLALAAGPTRDPGTYFFDQTFGDLQEELAAVKEGGKQALLIMFESEDCPWCAKMKKTVLNQPDIQDYYHQHFRILYVFIDSDSPLTDFSGKETTEKDFSFVQQRVRATPVFGFFDNSGKMVVRYTGITRDKEDFLLLGEYVAGGHYKKMKFRPWLKQRKQAGKSQGSSD